MPLLARWGGVGELGPHIIQCRHSPGPRELPPYQVGVIVDSKLSFSDHITEKVNKVYSILGIIKQNFQHVDKDALVLLYKALVLLRFQNGSCRSVSVGFAEKTSVFGSV